MVKLLLSHEGNPFRTDNEQRLCLHLCVGNTSSKNYVMLVKAMAGKLDLDQKDKVWLARVDNSVLYEAMSRGNSRSFEASFCTNYLDLF